MKKKAKSDYEHRIGQAFLWLTSFGDVQIVQGEGWQASLDMGLPWEITFTTDHCGDAASALFELEELLYDLGDRILATPATAE